jgi:type VI secretion system secreted protein Hcp
MSDAFVNFGDIKGESTDKDHKDWIEMAGYEHEIAHPQQSAAARSASAPHLSEFKILKRVDAASPKLYEACCKGTHIPEVTIELCKAGMERPVKYLEIKLKEVLISGVNTISDANAQPQFPSEAISLTYGAIEWTYTKQKPDGTAAGNVAAKWNLSKGAEA